MTIRKYQDTDREAVLELLRLNTPQYFAEEEMPDLIYYLDYHASHYYVAEFESRLLGCGGINFSDDGQMAKLSWDIVHPQSQGNGIGRALIHFRIEKIRETPTIKIISVRTSQLVWKFYEKFGFETKEIIRNFWAEGFDLYRMEREV
ncbi:MAG: GNAT family N-acetyltransferase [Bacteroidia bacterium]|nr:GNAT family N-acetyltransferase [Bacteroidia bacterium]